MKPEFKDYHQYLKELYPKRAEATKHDMPQPAERSKSMDRLRAFREKCP